MKYTIRTLLLAAAVSIPAAAAVADNYSADRAATGSATGAATNMNTGVGVGVGVGANVNTNNTNGTAGALQADGAVSAQSLSTAQVRQLQQSLNAQGLYSGSIDGIWGPGTADAISRFEQQNNLGTATPGALNTTTLGRLGIDTQAGAMGSGSGVVTTPNR